MERMSPLPAPIAASANSGLPRLASRLSSDSRNSHRELRHYLTDLRKPDVGALESCDVFVAESSGHPIGARSV
jgi:hypothetical protein